MFDFAERVFQRLKLIFFISVSDMITFYVVEGVPLITRCKKIL